MRTTRTLATILCCSAGLLAQDNAPSAKALPQSASVNGLDILRRSIATAERSWKAREQYTYTQRDEEKRLDSRGQVKSQDVNVSTVIFVNGAPFEQMEQHNGRIITAEQKRKQQEHQDTLRPLREGSRVRNEADQEKQPIQATKEFPKRGAWNSAICS